MTDSIDPAPLAAVLNQSTPYAPESEEEVGRRLAAETPAASSGSTPQDPSRTGGTRLARLSTVFVPTARTVGSNELPEYQLRVIEDGTAGLAIYTSVELLRTHLGVDQPWVEASLLELLYLVGRERIGVVVNPHFDRGLVADPKAGPKGGHE